MRYRLLIADDQEVMLRTLERLLTGRDSLEICGVARNGAEAVDKALQLHPDIIILDLAMPVMNGLEAAREIAKFLPQIPILLFTLTAVAEVKVEAEKVGVREVVSKAKGIGTLLMAIQSAVDDAEGKAKASGAKQAVPMANIESNSGHQKSKNRNPSSPSHVNGKAY